MSAPTYPKFSFSFEGVSRFAVYVIPPILYWITCIISLVLIIKPFAHFIINKFSLAIYPAKTSCRFRSKVDRHFSVLMSRDGIAFVFCIICFLFSLLSLYFVCFKSGFVRHDGHAIASGILSISVISVSCAIFIVYSSTPYFFLNAAPSGLEANDQVSDKNCRVSHIPLPIKRSTINFVIADVLLSTIFLLPWGWRPWQSLDNIRSIINFFLANSTYQVETDYPYSPSSLSSSGKLVSSLYGIQFPHGSSVDIYPWEINSVLKSGLAYDPRPIPQSYSAYTNRLQELNLKKLKSERGERYKLFSFEEIDYRFPAGLDSPSLRYILESFDSFKLSPAKKHIAFAAGVQRSSGWRGLSYRPCALSELSLNSSLSAHYYWIRSGADYYSSVVALPEIDRSSILFASSSFNKPVITNLISTLFKPPHIFMELLDDRKNKIGEWRIVPGAFTDVPVSPILQRSSDLERHVLQGTPSKAMPAYLRFRVSGLLGYPPYNNSSIQFDVLCSHS